MRLTKFTDYSFRVLLYAATLDKESLTTIEETSKVYDISRAHLKKVVKILIHLDYLEGVQGRNGGFRLALAPDQINLGQVLRKTEPDFGLAECFLPGNRCRITQACRMPVVLNKALANFLATFDNYTLADMLVAPHHFGVPEQASYPLRGPKLRDPT
jgi:Rrf2 family transcriptional regulator, nitric oxide-sensitive transcriptional repressor